MYSNYSYSQAVSGGNGHAQPNNLNTTSATWNGSQWVQQGTALQPNLASSPIKHGKTHAQLVTHYTAHYHYWNGQSEEAKLALPRIPPTSTNERDECERRDKWASYYASNAAALAHYHLSLSRGGAEPYQRPASPPAPPTTGATSTNNSTGVQPATTTNTTTSLVTTIQPATVVAKKSRWTTYSEDNTNGKSKSDANSSSAGNNSAGNGSSSSTAKSTLYNNFVGESSQKSKPSPSLGKKRKAEECLNSSASSVNDSYYGPSSSVTSSVRKKEDDFVPLGLDQPLGKNKKEKKEKKAKLAKAASFGFEVSSKAMTQRANRFQGKGGIDDVSSLKSTVENAEKYMGKTIIGGSNRQLDEEDFERMTVKGTCKVLEKEYLRLTAPPRPELVRPQPILEKHLANLLKSWKKGRKHGGKVRDYNWYCSQYKALRQDLQVQRIFNAFAVKVYESHAKLALEMDDINEYNQSQTQLKELYNAIQGNEDKPENKGALKNRNEFIAYRLIYYVFLSCNKKYDGGSSDLLKIMLQLTQEERKDPCIHHALLVREAVASNDYHKFFYLQDTAPNMGDFLMDKIVPSIRQSALQRMCKAYRPSVDMNFVLKELGFDISDKQDLKSGKVWMESCGCKFDGSSFLTKDTVLTESTLGKKNSLI
eukprot:scaffold21250_cov70-Cyclotella_meneghiniana.AAC.6